MNDSIKPIKWLALLSLILLATALRFYRLNAQDIWGDEAFSIFLSQQPLSTVIAGAADTHPPLYPLFLFAWLRMAGDSPFATRALSALVGVAIVPLTFVLSKRLAPARPRVAWFAGILGAVSPLLIYYSQETRMYELVALFALASVYFAARVLEDFRRERLQGAYLLWTALAMYTHYSAFFVWAAVNLFAVLRLRKEFRPLVRWALLQIILVAAYVPWIVVQSSFLSSKASGRFDEWGWNGVEMIFGKTLLSFSAGLTADYPIVQIAALAFLALAALSVITLARNGRNFPDGESPQLVWLAPVYFVVPVVVAYVVNPVMPFFFERYVLVALPGFLITVALGLDVLARHRAWMAAGAAGFFILISTYALSNYYFDDAYAKGKYGQMMAYVTDHAQAGDALILNNPLQKPLYLYYAPRGIPAYYIPDAAPLEDPSTRSQLDDVAHSHSRLWLVMFGNPAEYDPTRYLQRWLGANAFKTFFGGFVDASLSLYVMPSRAYSVSRAVDDRLGEDIHLIHVQLDRAQLAPGESLQLTLQWQTTKPIPTAFKVFTHVLGGTNPANGSPVWAQMDGEPVGGSRPTTTWQVGETIDDRYGLLVPPNTPPGDYTLEAGMYDPATLARLPVYDEHGSPVADDRVLLGTVHVSAQP